MKHFKNVYGALGKTQVDAHGKQEFIPGKEGKLIYYHIFITKILIRILYLIFFI